LSLAENLCIESALSFTGRLKYGGIDTRKTKIKNRKWRKKWL